MRSRELVFLSPKLVYLHHVSKHLMFAAGAPCFADSSAGQELPVFLLVIQGRCSLCWL